MNVFINLPFHTLSSGVIEPQSCYYDDHCPSDFKCCGPLPLGPGGEPRRYFKGDYNQTFIMISILFWGGREFLDGQKQSVIEGQRDRLTNGRSETSFMIDFKTFLLFAGARQVGNAGAAGVHQIR